MDLTSNFYLFFEIQSNIWPQILTLFRFSVKLWPYFRFDFISIKRFGHREQGSFIGGLMRTPWMPVRSETSRSITNRKHFYKARNTYLFRRGHPHLHRYANHMVFIFDGCSFLYAHIWSNSAVSICWRHLVTSKESSNPIFLSEKTYLTS